MSVKLPFRSARRISYAVESLEHRRLLAATAGVAFDQQWAAELASPHLRDPNSGITADDGKSGGDRPSANSAILSGGDLVAGAPALSSSFDAINFDSDTALASFNFIPPSPSGAAGPTQVVDVVNGAIQYFSKSGTQQFANRLGADSTGSAFGSFFAFLSPLTRTFDPKVIYDQYNGRFVVLALEQTDTANGAPGDSSRLFIAVSKDSNPNDGWYFGQINTNLILDSSTWMGDPGLAVDANAIYITGDMFGFGAGGVYQGCRLWIIPKLGFYSGLPISSTIYDPSTEASLPEQTFAMQPAQMFGTAQGTIGTFLVSSGWVNGATDFLSIIRISNPLTLPSFSNQFINLGDITNTSAAFPSAPQGGSSVPIDSGDNRIINAVWRNNSLYCADTCNATTGADIGTDTARWYRISTASLSILSLADQGSIGGETLALNTSTFYPSVMVDGAGNMAVDFAASGPNLYAGAYYTIRLSGDAVGTTQSPAALAAGVDAYVRTLTAGSAGPNRWGDYSSIALDPADASFWLFNEYAMTQGTPIGGESGRWGTRWGKLSLAGLPGSITGTVFQDLNADGVRGNVGSPTKFSATDLPTPIPDLGTATSTIMVSGQVGTVAKATVQLSLKHTYDGDLIGTLIAPDGTSVTLFSRVGSLGQNFTSTIFDDSASTAIISGVAPFTGSFKPQAALSAVNGQSLNGAWKLIITDNAAPDSGTLLSWSVTLTAIEPPIAGAMVYLDANSNGLYDPASDPHTTSDSNGTYSFTNLTAGNYTVSAVVSTGLIPTTPLPVPLSVASALTSTVNFGFFATSMIYVDASAAGANNGTSWNNAYVSLQSALAVASAGQTLRVAKGSYKPTASADRTISFQLKSGVGIYGGYAGFGATNPDARDLLLYPSTLSGDIGAIGNNADNTYHVVRAIAVDATAILNGFQITGGNASAIGITDGDGGGLLITSGSPNISNCIFLRNIALHAGGALADVNHSFPVLTQCQFDGNTADTGGALEDATTSGATLIECVFSGNRATGVGGGALYLNSGSTSAINCTFTANIAADGGFALELNASSLTLANCIVWANLATTHPAIDIADGTIAVTYTDFQGGITGAGNINADPIFAHAASAGVDGVWGTADDDYGDLRPQPGSGAIDSGNNAVVPASLNIDLAGKVRIVDFPGAHDPGAVVDMGAFEESTSLGILRADDGHTVTLPAGGYSFIATQIVIGAGGRIDVGDDQLLYDYTGRSPLATIRAALAQGFDAGNWDGLGIESSATAADTSHKTAVGFAEASAIGLSSFMGHSVDPTALLIRYTRYGDNNLDGVVDIGNDFGLFIDGFTAHGTTWLQGDYTYDARVGLGNDFNLFLRNYLAASAPPAAPAAPATAIPAAVALPPKPLAADPLTTTPDLFSNDAINIFA